MTLTSKVLKKTLHISFKGRNNLKIEITSNHSTTKIKERSFSISALLSREGALAVWGPVRHGVPAVSSNSSDFWEKVSDLCFRFTFKFQWQNQTFSVYFCSADDTSQVQRINTKNRNGDADWTYCAWPWQNNGGHCLPKALALSMSGERVAGCLHV